MKKSISFIVLCCMATGLHAQTPDVSKFNVAQSDAVPKLRLEKFQEDSASTSSIAGASSKVSFEATNEKSVAAVKLGKTKVFSSSQLIGKFALSAKSPFDKEKANSRDLGTLSGLTSGTSIQLETGLLRWPNPTPSSLEEVDRACAKAIEAIFPGYSWWMPGKEQNLARYFNGPGMDGVSCVELLNPANPDALEAAVKKRAAANAKVSAANPQAVIAPLVVPENLKTLQERGRAKLFDAAEKASPPAHGVNFVLKANRQKFSYVTAATPTMSTDENKEGYGAELSFSRVAFRYVASAGIGWEKSYKGKDETQVCNPIGTTGSFTCEDASIGAPTEKDEQIAFVELRQRFESVPWLAISPRVEFGFDDSELGVRLPIYLAPNKERPLDGGIALGWTEEDHFSASVFVGKSFAFFD